MTLLRAWWGACLPSRVAGVTVGRHLVRQVLHEWDLAPLVQPGELAVCELLSNAVRHAGGRVLTVRMELADNLLIAVGDQDPGLLQLPDPAARPRAADTGRGLLIVDRIAAAWGATGVTGGKEVWFRLNREPNLSDLRPIRGDVGDVPFAAFGALRRGAVSGVSHGLGGGAELRG